MGLCSTFTLVQSLTLHLEEMSRALVPGVLEFLPCLPTPLFKEGRQSWLSEGSAHEEAKSIFCNNLV